MTVVKPKMYDVTCQFEDGSTSKYEYLSHIDMLTVLDTFENLNVVSCGIKRHYDHEDLPGILLGDHLIAHGEDPAQVGSWPDEKRERVHRSHRH